MDYKQTIDYLYGAMPSFQQVGATAYKPGLERIRSFCESIGSPHLAMPTIHIAGTNGKGSTSHMMAAVLQSAGYRVGLFTSPHLRDFRERMRVDGQMISQSEVVEFVATHRDAMQSAGLSFFEMTAAMAFDMFARSQVDVAVVECGLGGRLDATNIVEPQLSIITNIDLDHTQYLGTTLAQIAGEKAGIIKAGRPVVVGEASDEYRAVFEQRAEQLGCELRFAQECYEVAGVEYYADFQRLSLCSADGNGVAAYDLQLMGDYQQCNIVTLRAAVECINSRDDISLSISDQAVHDGLRRVVDQTNLMGRWQLLGRNPLMVCDTGHNPHGLRQVVRQIERQKYAKLYCVVGFANDKDVRGVLAMFPSDAHFIFTQAKTDRAYPVAELERMALDMGLRCEAVADVEGAVERAKELAAAADMIYIGGSTFVVAEVPGLEGETN